MSSTGSDYNDDHDDTGFPQNLPLTYSLAAIGGLLEVAATAVLAVPDAKLKQGIELSWIKQKLALAGNISMQLIGSLLSNLFAPWFGPVSVVAPIYFSSTLVANMMIFGALLGLEFFDKTMRVGTYVIVVATMMLTIVGPGVQEGQSIDDMMSQPLAVIWFGLLLAGMSLTGLILASGITKYGEQTRISILLIARSTSFTLNLTVSRSFVLGPSRTILLIFIVIKIISGFLYTMAIVVQSTTVIQSKFVPLNATTIILINAFTGIIIWDDGNVVSSWMGYFCVFVLLALGCDLLLSVPLLNSDNVEYGAMRRASMVLPRMPGQRDLYYELDYEDDDSDGEYSHGAAVIDGMEDHPHADSSEVSPLRSKVVSEENAIPTSASKKKERSKRISLSRKEAWGNIAKVGKKGMGALGGALSDMARIRAQTH